MAESKSTVEGFSGVNAANDFLTSQKSLAPYLKFTIEELPDPKMVKVTPHVPIIGCLCQLGITVPKLVLIVIRPTGEYVACCGKRLQLAEITFAPDAKVDLADMLGQLTSAAETSHVSSSNSAGGCGCGGGGGGGGAASGALGMQGASAAQFEGEIRRLMAMEGELALLGGCPTWKKWVCGVGVGAAVAACAYGGTAGCTSAVKLLKEAGCCDCLPDGWIKDLCKRL